MPAHGPVQVAAVGRSKVSAYSDRWVPNAVGAASTDPAGEFSRVTVAAPGAGRPLRVSRCQNVLNAVTFSPVTAPGVASRMNSYRGWPKEVTWEGPSLRAPA